MTPCTHKRRRGRLGPSAAILTSSTVCCLLSAVCCSALIRGADAPKPEVPRAVLDAEARRVAAVQKVQPAVVAVMTGGGSGVLISDDGYALTNFHVVEAAHGPFMKCGLADGVLYDAVLVGLDKVGDVALIKLLPKKPGDKFPFARMGDSDKVQAGDWSLAMGNPFLLATDFTPTVTFGLISGVHRYQYPAGTLLEYTNCIQIDTSINPGNSGGPLFNMDGELIGINGRGSFEKRGRVNSGVGYAISINQIKNFMGQLRAGMDTDHASLGASMKSDMEEGALSKVVVGSVIESDAVRRGLDVDDQLVSFAGVPIFTVNQFKNTLGLFPRGWRVPLVFRRQNDKNEVEKKEVLVRLMGIQRQELPGQGGEDAPPGGPGPMPPGRRPPGQPPVNPGEAAKFYKAKPKFANYYFNELERDRLLKEFARYGDFSKVQGDWKVRAGGLLYAGDSRGRRIAAELTVKHKGAKDGQNDLVQGIVDGLEYSLEPLNEKEKSDNFRDPPGSGGLLLALYQYRQFLAFGIKGFVGDFSHGGIEPFYPPLGSGEKADYDKRRVDCEVIRTVHAGMPAKWYFSTKEGTRGQLLGFEVWPEREEDPCEVYLAEYKEVEGRQLPHRIEVRFGDKTYAVLNVNTWKLSSQ
jgi:serine protease Do